MHLGAILRVQFALEWCWTSSFIPRSKLESETPNQIDTFFWAPSTADNIHQTVHWKILGNEGDANLLKEREVRTTERMGAMLCTYRIWAPLKDLSWFWFPELPCSIPLSLRPWKHGLRRSCSFCSLPVPSTTWDWELTHYPRVWLNFLGVLSLSITRTS